MCERGPWRVAGVHSRMTIVDRELSRDPNAIDSYSFHRRRITLGIQKTSLDAAIHPNTESDDTHVRAATFAALGGVNDRLTVLAPKTFNEW